MEKGIVGGAENERKFVIVMESIVVIYRKRGGFRKYEVGGGRGGVYESGISWKWDGNVFYDLIMRNIGLSGAPAR